jgi:hypothetical protein
MCRDGRADSTGETRRVAFEQLFVFGHSCVLGEEVAAVGAVDAGPEARAHDGVPHRERHGGEPRVLELRAGDRALHPEPVPRQVAAALDVRAERAQALRRDARAEIRVQPRAVRVHD